MLLEVRIVKIVFMLGEGEGLVTLRDHDGEQCSWRAGFLSWG